MSSIVLAIGPNQAERIVGRAPVSVLAVRQ